MLVTQNNMADNSTILILFDSPKCPHNPFENTITGIVITHVSLLIALIGIPVNVLTLIVLRQNSSRNATNLLLAVLATEDILITMSYSLYYVAIHYFENYHITYLGLLRYADSPLYFILNWVKVTEIYTIVLLSLQRYFAIRWPLHAASLCSLGRTKRLLLTVICVSALLKLPNLILGYRIMVYDVLCGQFILREVFGNRPWYTHFKLLHGQVLDQVFSYLIPLTVLIVLNIGLIIRVHKVTRQRLQDDGLGLTEPSGSFAVETGVQMRTRSFIHWSIDNEKPGIGKPSMLSSGERWKAELPGECGRATRGWSMCRPRPTHPPAFTQANTQSRSVTLTLIGVVSTFIVFETPTTVCFCYEFRQLITEQFGLDAQGRATNETVVSADEWGFYHYAYPAALICVLIGCASNFFIYMLIGSKFRRLCFRVLRRLWCLSSKCWNAPDQHGGMIKTRWISKRPIRRRVINGTTTEVTQTTFTLTEAYPYVHRPSRLQQYVESTSSASQQTDKQPVM